MKRWPLLFISLWLFFYTSIHVLADHLSTIEEFDKLSNDALQFVKTSRYDDALRLLQVFADEFIVFTMYEGDLSKADIQLISLLNEEAIQAVKDGDRTHAEKVNEVTKLRLAVDAAIHSTQPLWQGMKEPMLAILDNIKEAIKMKDHTNLHSQLNSFLNLYDVIYPSLKMNVSLEQLQKIDTQVVFLDKYRSQLFTKENSQQELEALQQELEAVFNNIEEDEADPSLWWVIIMTGSIIILTLSYVGYRKFIGEKEKEKLRRKGRERSNLFDTEKRNR